MAGAGRHPRLCLHEEKPGGRKRITLQIQNLAVTAVGGTHVANQHVPKWPVDGRHPSLADFCGWTAGRWWRRATLALDGLIPGHDRRNERFTMPATTHRTAPAPLRLPFGPPPATRHPPDTGCGQFLEPPRRTPTFPASRLHTHWRHLVPAPTGLLDHRDWLLFSRSAWGYQM
jgi:hypothetical protein